MKRRDHRYATPKGKDSEFYWTYINTQSIVRRLVDLILDNKFTSRCCAAAALQSLWTLELPNKIKIGIFRMFVEPLLFPIRMLNKHQQCASHSMGPLPIKYHEFHWSPTSKINQTLLLQMRMMMGCSNKLTFLQIKIVQFPC